MFWIHFMGIRNVKNKKKSNVEVVSKFFEFFFSAASAAAADRESSNCQVVVIDKIFLGNENEKHTDTRNFKFLKKITFFLMKKIWWDYRMTKTIIWLIEVDLFFDFSYWEKKILQGIWRNCLNEWWWGSLVRLIEIIDITLQWKLIFKLIIEWNLNGKIFSFFSIDFFFFLIFIGTRICFVIE